MSINVKKVCMYISRDLIDFFFCDIEQVAFKLYLSQWRQHSFHVFPHPRSIERWTRGCGLHPNPIQDSQDPLEIHYLGETWRVSANDRAVAPAFFLISLFVGPPESKTSEVLSSQSVRKQQKYAGAGIQVGRL